jgi:hypothetical protein
MEKIKSSIVALAAFPIMFVAIEHAGAGAPISVCGTPVTGPGTLTTCGVTYAGYVTCMPTNTWGWTPDTNYATNFTAADGSGRTDTFVLYTGILADKGCGQTQVVIPNPPHSTQYRFTIYYPTNVPTTNCPILLTGFVPPATNN